MQNHNDLIVYRDELPQDIVIKNEKALLDYKFSAFDELCENTKNAIKNIKIKNDYNFKINVFDFDRLKDLDERNSYYILKNQILNYGPLMVSLQIDDQGELNKNFGVTHYSLLIGIERVPDSSFFFSVQDYGVISYRVMIFEPPKNPTYSVRVFLNGVHHLSYYLS